MASQYDAQNCGISCSMRVKTKHSSLALERWYRFVTIFTFLDLLLLPRMLFAFGVPVSLVLVTLTIFLSSRVKFEKFIYALLLLTIMLASVQWGLVTDQNFSPTDSVKRAFQLTAILLYAQLSLNTAQLTVPLLLVLRFFFFWIAALLILFLTNQEHFSGLIAMIYPESMDFMEFNIEGFRFSYLYSDPNSAAYLICIALFAYLNLEKNSTWIFTILTIAFLAVAVSQSRGAYICFILILMHHIYESRKRTSSLFIYFIGVAIIAFFLYYYYGDALSDAYAIFESRFDAEDDLGGGRTGKYIYFLTNFNVMPFGTGYHLLRDNIEFRPHSDLIRLNLAYGLFSVPIVLYFVYPRNRYQFVFLVLLLIPFLINSIIDDFRLFGLSILFMKLLGSHSQQPLIEN